MANAKKTAVKRTTESKEVKVVVELNIPQLDANRSSSPSIVSRMRAITAANIDGFQKATITIKPVQDIHIVELEVNTIELAKNTDVNKDDSFSASDDIFPTRPLSLFIHITGNPNTMIEINMDVAGINEFKGNLFIPSSGRLVIQKNIA